MERARKAAAGDEQVWRELLVPILPHFFAFILQTGTSCQDEAKDLLQDICVCIHHDIGKYNATGRLEKWMWGLVWIQIKHWQQRDLGKLRMLSSLSRDEADETDADDDTSLLITDLFTPDRLTAQAIRQARAEAVRGSVLVRLHRPPVKIDWDTKYVDEFLEPDKDPSRDDRRRLRAATRGDEVEPQREDSRRDLLVHLILKHVGETDRQILQLRLDGYTFREIGAILSTTASAANMRHSRIVASLRRELGGRPHLHTMFLLEDAPGWSLCK